MSYTIPGEKIQFSSAYIPLNIIVLNYTSVSFQMDSALFTQPDTSIIQTLSHTETTCCLIYRFWSFRRKKRAGQQTKEIQTLNKKKKKTQQKGSAKTGKGTETFRTVSNIGVCFGKTLLIWI